MQLLLVWQFMQSTLGRAIIVCVVVAAVALGIYGKGRSDGRAAYQAKLTREINQAIAKGERARAEALKKFDATKDFTDGFERD